MIVAQLVERLLPNSYILEGCGSNLVIGSLKHNSIAKMRQLINSKRVLMVLSAKYFPNVQSTFCPIEFPITQRIKNSRKNGKTKQHFGILPNFVSHQIVVHDVHGYCDDGGGDDGLTVPAIHVLPTTVKICPVEKEITKVASKFCKILNKPSKKCPCFFKKWAIPGRFFIYFRLFKQTQQFLHQIYGAGIRT